VGGALRRVRGGICGLLSLERAQWEAIEADLLARGFTLADIPRRVSWRALKVFISHAPRESAIFRVAGPVSAQWDTAEHLLAAAVDLLRVSVWQKTKDGSTGRNQPKPIKRPGDLDPNRKFGGRTVMDLTEARDWVAKRRAGRLSPMKLAEEVS
jgi:Family of unknown function (DUF5361)